MDYTNFHWPPRRDFSVIKQHLRYLSSLVATLPGYTYARNTYNACMVTEDLHAGVKNAAWGLVATWFHVHTQTCTPKKKGKKKNIPCSMPKQADPAPDTAVVFSADNLLPRIYLSGKKNVSRLVRKSSDPFQVTGSGRSPI